MKQASNAILAAVLGTAGLAAAQPAPADPAGAPGPGPQSPYGPDPAPPPALPVPAPPIDPPRPPRVHKPLRFPEVLTTPTGWLLPAGVLYSRSSIDTGGGIASDSRVGLGDVAEFGVATTDQVRERNTAADTFEQIQPYVTASFRLGVEENRLFTGQPGVTLGFRKSFEREHLGSKTRIAELTLVASKHLGPDAAIHIGGTLWDASLQEMADAAMPPPEVTLHGHLKDQIRAFGGFEAAPLPRSQILIDLGWAPDFCYQCGPTRAGTIQLRPELSWGVRYKVASFMHIESGVRVPDIGNFNLLDAQIFGQITLTSFALSDAVETLK
ncbi:MAG TPA: hypothetical protein VHW23_13715 [Kofleriaceae bacterium]|nr:hypothetical protein [Kofleriaceae bacterium]